MKNHLRKRTDCVRIAQWICDEGWISTTYYARLDETFLVVGGNVTDAGVLRLIARILHEKVTRETGTPHPGWLPMSAVKVRSAEARTLLQTVLPELTGLKKTEAKAALEFFPPSGRLKGRHPTQEFMIPVWVAFARGVISHRNRTNPIPVTLAEEEALLQSWVEMRLNKGIWNRRHEARQKPNLDASMPVRSDTPDSGRG